MNVLGEAGGLLLVEIVDGISQIVDLGARTVSTPVSTISAVVRHPWEPTTARVPAELVSRLISVAEAEKLLAERARRLGL